MYRNKVQQVEVVLLPSVVTPGRYMIAECDVYKIVAGLIAILLGRDGIEKPRY